MPRFQPKHSPLQLLDIIRQVSREAAPADPRSCTQSAFDEHRDGAPTARAIVKRLAVSWPTLLGIAHAPRSDAMRRLSHAQADKGRKNLTLERVATAMRQVALRLDKHGINRTDYRDGRATILGESGRGRPRAAAERALPELGQLETVLKQEEMRWEDGLIMAGLELPGAEINTGMALTEAIGRFADTIGKAPRGTTQLKQWSAQVGLSLKLHNQADFEAALQAVREERASAGLPELERAGTGEHLDSGLGTIPVPAGKSAKRPFTDREEILDGLALAVRLLDPGEQLSQRSLKRIVKQNPGRRIPSWSSVDRRRRNEYPDESWDDWRREAEQRAHMTGR